jgi:hypothetical protein
MRRDANRIPREAIVSHTRRIVAGCSGKRCYDTKHVADRLAKLTRRNREKFRGGAYRCPNCHAWHIGEL